MSTLEQAAPGRVYEIVIGGMTCASCAARVERKLNALDGVAATVNYATERARVTAAARAGPARAGGAGETGGLHGAAHRRPGRPGRGYGRATGWPICGGGWRSRRCWPCRCATCRWRCRCFRSCGSRAGSGCVCCWRARCRVVRVAVPPRRRAWPAPRRVLHGHARLDGHPCRPPAGRVGDGPRRPGQPRYRSGLAGAVGRRPRAVPGGCGRGDDVPARRAVLRGAGQAGRRRRRCGRCWSWAPTTSKCCATTSPLALPSPSCWSMTCSGCGRGEGRHRRRGGGGLVGAGHEHGRPVSRCRARSASATRWWAARSTAGACCCCGPPGSGPTRTWPD